MHLSHSSPSSYLQWLLQKHDSPYKNQFKVNGQSYQFIDFCNKNNAGQMSSEVSFLVNLDINQATICRRGGPLVKAANFINEEGIISLKNTTVEEEDLLLRKGLQEMVPAKTMVELLKVEEPIGEDVQVSYSQMISRWIISNYNKTFIWTNQENQQIQSEENKDKTILLWKSFLEGCQNENLLKDTLSKFTLCGKANLSTKKIVWYSVVKTEDFSSLCQDLFDAKTVVQKLGMTFARITTVSVLDNLDPMMRALRKLITTVQGSHSQTKKHKLGRCKVYLISTPAKNVLGGFQIRTLEDSVFSLMKKIAYGNQNSQEKEINLEGSLLQLTRRNVLLPYPVQHYIQIFKTLLELTENIPKDGSIEDWFTTIKMALYLNVKGIQIKSFGNYFFQQQKVRQKLKNIAFEDFGPINCKIVTFYCLFNPNPSLRKKIMNALKDTLGNLNLHYSVLNSSNMHQIDINPIIELIAEDNSDHKLKHCFIDSIPRLFQLRALLKQLQVKGQTDTFYQIALIVEKQDDFLAIQQNVYPFSAYALAESYLQAYKELKSLPRLNQRAEGMVKVTEIVENSKNQEFRIDDSLIRINLGNKGPEKAIKNNIELILKEKQREKVNLHYYRLMIQFDKMNQDQKTELIPEDIVRQIISQSYTKVSTIKVEP